MPTNHTNRYSLACTHCALLNISERRTCKRCHAILDPTAQVWLPASPSQRATLPWGCLVVFGSFWGFIVLFLILSPPPPSIPAPGSTITFRGDDIALLRMVTQPPYEAITVHRDGRVVRSSYSTTVPSVATYGRVTAAELEAIHQLRRQWCQQVPTFRPLEPGESFYDLAVECGGHTAKQAKVPIELVPAIFETLLQRFPRAVQS